MATSSAKIFRPNFEGVPSELRDLPRWVMWCGEIVNNRLTKIPYATNGQHASTTDAKTWGTFADVVEAYEAGGGFNGIGFVFNGDGLIGIDLDHCRDPISGIIEPKARGIIERLDTFAEVSPSGTGVHCLIRGKLNGRGNRFGNIELYSTKRYFCVTGNHLEGTPLTLEDRQTELDDLYSELPGTTREKVSQNREDWKNVSVVLRPNAEPPEKFNALFENSEQFKRTWNRQRADLDNDNSRYDQSLANQLISAGWTDQETADLILSWRRRHNADLVKMLNSKHGLVQRAIAFARQGSGAANDDPKEGGKAEQRDNVGARLVKFARQKAELIHTPDGRTFALVNGHRTMAIGERGSAFRSWLSAQFTETNHNKPPRGGDLGDALTAINGLALEGPSRRVYTRIAGHGGDIYIDLGGTDERAIKITPDGWSVVERPPVLFTASKALAALPAPDEKGGVKDLIRLKKVLNMSDEDFYLVVCWMIGALRPGIPYPVLLLSGLAGTAKSTGSAIIRSLIDPAGEDGRLIIGPPKDAKDLFAASKGAHVFVLNNLNFIPGWLSDFCRVWRPAPARWSVNFGAILTWPLFK